MVIIWIIVTFNIVIVVVFLTTIITIVIATIPRALVDLGIYSHAAFLSPTLCAPGRVSRT